MSYVFVDTGQCGNQLGCSILDSLHQHLVDDPIELDSFFRTSNSRNKSTTYARAVCIDTEPKVIHACMQRIKDKKTWLFDSKSTVYGHGGAGNNWAMGYQLCRGEFLENSLECIRRELEMCNGPPTLIITHSVAGGTGSGCGTRITEATSDEFPDVNRMNIAVTPYHFGEVVVQHFNTVLCLSKLSSASHGVLTFENEVAKQLCMEMKGIERPTLHDVNDIIAANIVPSLLPKHAFNDDQNSSNSYSHISSYSTTIADDIGELCSHPGYRFLTVKNVPQTSKRSVTFTYDSWSSLVDTLQRMNFKGSFSERGTGSSSAAFSRPKAPHAESVCTTQSDHVPYSRPDASPGFRSLKSVLTLRGPDAQSGLLSLKDTSIAASNAYVPYSKRATSNMLAPVTMFDDSRCVIHHSAHTVNNYQRSAVLLSNSQEVLPLLQRAALKAAAMYRAGAYVHQYKSCGLEDEDFVRAFRTVGQVVENYASI
jgi:tubulin delta